MTTATATQGATAMPDVTDPLLAEIRYWKAPAWKVIVDPDTPAKRYLRLIVGHPATGARIASFDHPAATPEQEDASKRALVAWANAYAEQQPSRR